MDEYRKSLRELPESALLTLFALTKMAQEAGTYPEIKAGPIEVAEYINSGFAQFVSPEYMIEQIIKAQV